jgi:RNA polymerase sigma factor for flagellar operon FliA
MRDERAMWEEYGRTRSVAGRNALAEMHLPLVDKVVERVASKAPPQADRDGMLGDGHLGLLRAVEGFDPSKGLQFNTYASRVIFGAVIDGIRDMDWVPRLTRARQKRGELSAEPPEIGSLAAVVHEGDKAIPLSARLADLDAADPHESAASSDGFLSLVARTGARERFALTLYFRDGLAMKAIGRAAGCSESRISQMISAAIGEIRASLEGRPAKRRRLSRGRKRPAKSPVISDRGEAFRSGRAAAVALGLPQSSVSASIGRGTAAGRVWRRITDAEFRAATETREGVAA